MKHAIVCWLVIMGLISSGCAAQVGTGGTTYVPKDAAATCAAHCGDIGMSLDSVVIMASTVGCVCKGAKSTAVSSEGSGAAGGMAALIIAAQQQQQQQAQRAR